MKKGPLRNKRGPHFRRSRLRQSSSFAKGKRETGRCFRPRQSVVTEVRECAPTNIDTYTHRSPQSRRFDSATVVDTEKRAIVGYDDFASCIERRRSRCSRCVDLTIDKRRAA